MHEEFKYRRTEDLGDLTHEQLMPVHNEEFKRLNRRIADLEELSERGIGEVSSIKTDIDWIKKQIIASTEQTKAIYQLGASVEHMTIEVGKLSTQVEKVATMAGDHENRLNTFEKENYVDKIKLIEDELNIIKNKPANVILNYIDYVAKGILLVFAIGFLVYLFGDKVVQ